MLSVVVGRVRSIDIISVLIASMVTEGSATNDDDETPNFMGSWCVCTRYAQHEVQAQHACECTHCTGGCFYSGATPSLCEARFQRSSHGRCASALSLSLPVVPSCSVCLTPYGSVCCVVSTCAACVAAFPRGLARGRRRCELLLQGRRFRDRQNLGGR